MKNWDELMPRRWDRWLCGFAVLVLGATMVFSVLQARHAQQGYDARLARLASGEALTPTHVRAIQRYAIQTLDAMRHLIVPDSILTKRDIFNSVVPALPAAAAAPRPATAEPDFEIIEISYKPFPLQYRGCVVFKDGTLTAQINYEKKSFLLRRGMRVADYVVIAVDHDRVVLQQGSQLIRLAYQEMAYSDTRLARIKDRQSQQTRDVVIGDRIADFEVLDITEKSVLLSNRKRHLELQKGKVQP